MRDDSYGDGSAATEEIVCEPCGEMKARTWRSPINPTSVEVAEHDLTHCPYRTWCAICVAAMGREDPHPRRDLKKESELLIIGMDYDKYREEEGVATQITAIYHED